jgi:hypothetical protein
MRLGPKAGKAKLQAVSRNVAKAGDKLKKAGFGKKPRQERSDDFEKTSTSLLAGTARALEGMAGAALDTVRQSDIGRGMLGWDADAWLLAGAKQAASNVAAGFDRLASEGEKWLRGIAPYTAREATSDPQSTQLTQRLFGPVGQKLKGSAEQVALLGAQFASSMSELAASGDARLAAGVVNSTAGQLAKTAALTTSAASVKMGEFGLRLAQSAVGAVDRQLPGSADLVELAAQFTAATADILVAPLRDGLRGEVAEKIHAATDQLQALHSRFPALSAKVA